MSASPAIGNQPAAAATDPVSGLRAAGGDALDRDRDPVAFVLVASTGFDASIPLWPILSICALQAVLNLPPLWRPVAALASESTSAFAQILVDILALTGIAYFAGGGTNPLISLYLPLIAVAATILPPRRAAAIVGFQSAATRW